MALARDRWSALRDSIAAIARDSAVAVTPTVDRFGFDARSFSLSVIDRALQVRFAVTQSGADEEANVVELEAIDVDAPSWFEALRPEYPIDERAEERLWPRDGFTLVGRPADDPRARVALSLRDPAGTEWRLGSVPSPVLRVMWIGDSSAVPGTRAALTKAFNDASFYSGENRIVRHTPRAARVAPLVVPASARKAPVVVPRRLAPSPAARRARSGT